MRHRTDGKPPLIVAAAAMGLIFAPDVIDAGRTPRARRNAPWGGAMEAMVDEGGVLESLDIGQGVRDRPLIGGFVRGEPARVSARGFKGSDQAKRSTRRGGNPAVTRYARKLAKAGRL